MNKFRATGLSQAATCLTALLSPLSIALLSGCGGGSGSDTGTNVGIDTNGSGGTVTTSSVQLRRDASNSSIEVRSTASSLTVAGPANQEQTFRTRSPGLNVSAWSNKTTGDFVLRDETHGYTLAVQKTANFTATRVYDLSGRWLGGGLSYDDGAGMRISPMRTENDTTTLDRTVVSTALSAASSGPNVQILSTTLAASQGECEAYIGSISSAPAEFASNASGALEKSGELADLAGLPKPPSILGRLLGFLGDLLGSTPSLCADAAKPISDKDFERTYTIKAYDAIFDTNTQSVLETAQSLADFKAKLDALVQAAIARRESGSNFNFESSSIPEATGLASTSTAEAVSSLDSNKLEVPGLNASCLTGVSVPVVVYANDGTTQSFRYRDDWTNQCGMPVNVVYCATVSTSQCVPNNFQTLAVSASFSRIGRETVNDKTAIVEGTRFVVCPDKSNGKTVYPDGRNKPSCYVYKS